MSIDERWAKLAAVVPPSEVQWRQQGKPKAKDGKFYAPYVAYIDAQFVRQRLDDVFPSEWELSLELLPPLVAIGGDGEQNDEPVSFKARLSVGAVRREDVGTGRDYKTAATDAFKRAAVRFGIAHELYTDYEIVYVQVDSDSKFARAVEDPADAWRRKTARNGTKHPVTTPDPYEAPPIAQPAKAESEAPATSDEPSCPKCGGRMWDNRVGKKNPKAPDYKCRSKSCDGVIWPPRANGAPAPTRAVSRGSDDDFPESLRDGPDNLPF